MKRGKPLFAWAILGIALGTGIGTVSADDVQVNTYTTSFQERPAVALNDQGEFVIVWISGESAGTDTSGSSIQGQLYTPDGNAIGGQFQVNTDISGDQGGAAVAIDTDGNFVVVWDTGFSFSDSVKGQRYAADGSPIGGQFDITNGEFNYQINPTVASDGDGDFVVVWSSYRPDLPPTGEIHGQRFASDGSPQGQDFQINAYTTGLQGSPTVASDGDGDFVVIWTNPDLRGQRFASDGSRQGAEFQVNAYTSGLQTLPSVAMDSDGDFIVAWQSQGSLGTDNSGLSIQAQRFASNGTRVGDEFQVNAFTTDDQGRPEVAMNGAGDFVVAWQSQGSTDTDTSGLSIQAQRFASDGATIGGEFQVNSLTSQDQNHPSVALDPFGDLLVAWTSQSSAGDDTDGTSIQRTPRGLIFADGFESGDTSAWSGDD